jgi:hypothetical protein
MSKMRKITHPTLMLDCLFGILVLHWILPLGSIFSWTLLLCGGGFSALGLGLPSGWKANSGEMAQLLTVWAGLQNSSPMAGSM